MYLVFCLFVCVCVCVCVFAVLSEFYGRFVVVIDILLVYVFLFSSSFSPQLHVCWCFFGLCVYVF